MSSTSSIRLNFFLDTAYNIKNQIRAFNPAPVAWTTLGDEKIKVYQAQLITSEQNLEPGLVIDISSKGVVVHCGQDQLLLEKIQFPGKSKISYEQIYNAYKDKLKDQYFI